MRLKERVSNLANRLEVTDNLLWFLCGFFGGIVFAVVVVMNYPAWLL